MGDQFDSDHFTTEAGLPDGGVTQGRGFVIAWQRGALAGDVRPEECVVPEHIGDDGKHGCPGFPGDTDGDGNCPNRVCPRCGVAAIPCRRERNGAFVEEIIDAARDRIAYYQETRFECGENAVAIEHLDKALAALRSRTAKRASLGIDGTHEPHETSVDEAHVNAEHERRERIEVSLAWVGDGPCWVTRPSGSVEGPLNKQSAIDILLAEPTSGVHLFDPRG